MYNLRRTANLDRPQFPALHSHFIAVRKSRPVLCKTTDSGASSEHIANAAIVISLSLPVSSYCIGFIYSSQLIIAEWLANGYGAKESKSLLNEYFGD